MRNINASIRPTIIETRKFKPSPISFAGGHPEIQIEEPMGEGSREKPAVFDNLTQGGDWAYRLSAQTRQTVFFNSGSSAMQCSVNADFNIATAAFFAHHPEIHEIDLSDYSLQDDIQTLRRALIKITEGISREKVRSKTKKRLRSNR